MPRAAIKGIEYYLPERSLTNENLEQVFEDWSARKIFDKTGIRERHIAEDNQCSSDLGEAAALKLFAAGHCKPGEVDFLLLCTQSPDYFLPTTACLLQDRLGLPVTAGALDFNLGCSGFVYGLGLAKGLIETGQATNVLLITAETYSKFMNPRDRGVRAIFGDGAAATLISATDGREAELLGPFAWGTDGSGAKNLIVAAGGMRGRAGAGATPSESLDLFMNGPEIFQFTLRTVPDVISRTLALAKLEMEQVDLWVFHQANLYMMDHLRRKLGIGEERFMVFLDSCGNTVSSTIPIALREAVRQGRLKQGSVVMIVGFGVGYSWGAAVIRWEEALAVPQGRYTTE